MNHYEREGAQLDYWDAQICVDSRVFLRGSVVSKS